MKDMMQYKGYLGSVHYSDEDETFFGKVEFIRSLISYEGFDVKSLKTAFQQAIDDYLELCQERSTVPEKSFKGSFNIRVGSHLHRQAALYALSHDTNLNSLISNALEEYLVSHQQPLTNYSSSKSSL